MAVHVVGICSYAADDISRGRAGDVLAEADAAGLCCERLSPVAEAALVLKQVRCWSIARGAESLVRGSQ